MTLCEYFPQCTGCSSWNIPFAEQNKTKIESLKLLLRQNDVALNGPIGFISPGEHSLRHRMDFTLAYDGVSERSIFGFYDKNKQLVSINRCLQLSPELQSAFTDFIALKFKNSDYCIKKASVRLRIGPNGQRGCWLDLANLDVKNLLAEKTILNAILDAGFKVEIGQKGKSLVHKNNELKLAAPLPDTWFKTCDVDGKDLDLNCLISDFTQPSWWSAQELVRIVQTWIANIKTTGPSNEIVEFGPGSGQFTLNFLSAGYKVHALEIDASACENLRFNAERMNKLSQLTIHNADFHRQIFNEDVKAQVCFVNPARSGLKIFTDRLMEIAAEHVIYVSCFPQSMAADLNRMQSLYEVADVTIVDQFPQTEHFETCVLLKKKLS